VEITIPDRPSDFFGSTSSVIEEEFNAIRIRDIQLGFFDADGYANQISITSH